MTARAPLYNVARAMMIVAILVGGCSAPPDAPFRPKEVHRTGDLIIEQVSPNTFVHTSYKQTDEFGNVPCNGLVVRNGGETIVFDTPTNDSSATELIHWIQGTLHCRIDAVIPTHFHDDCLGGLKAFHANGVPSYANAKTIELAQANGMPVPQHGFTDSLSLPVGEARVTATFHGEGHTKDNVVGYFPSEHVLFGGCLIKELDATKGYLGDANVDAWSGTVEAVKHGYPCVHVVVPGHGKYGDQHLLDYTIGLFKAR